MAAPITVGLPVFNGERYLAEAIDSLLAQTFEDFELVIVDDASSDATPAIIERYARRDRRIRVYRNPLTLGLGRNFTRAFQLSTSRYFKWLAADDVCRPRFLERCYDALERNPDAVLAYPRAEAIDEHGAVLHDYGWTRTGGHDHPDPLRRWSRLLEEFADDGWSIEDAGGARIGGGTAPVYLHGLIRAEALWSARPFGRHTCADQNLLAELALLGPFHEVGERLSRIRIHRGASTAHVVNWDPRRLQDLLDPRTGNGLHLWFMSHRSTVEFARTVATTSGGPREKLVLASAIVRPSTRRAGLRLAKIARHVVNGSHQGEARSRVPGAFEVQPRG